ncbi:MAG: hypothetical protein IH913_02225 [Proteobacteria bacterium]|nr:hypothetical protein [Pseudomonadota bacterium]
MSVGSNIIIVDNVGDRPISKDKAFDECVVLNKDTFDPDAVFLEDIVDDDVLPYLSLAVDGLTAPGEGKKGSLELRPEDVAANEEIKADTTMPVAVLGPDQLDVYGWETSLWKKIKGYLGF